MLVFCWPQRFSLFSVQVKAPRAWRMRRTMTANECVLRKNARMKREEPGLGNGES